MTPTTDNGFVVIDANILISLCAKEPTQTTVKQVLENYAKDGWSFYAPNLIVAEVLYILCQKHQKNTLTDKSYQEAVENFQDQMKAIQTINDDILIKRAAEIQKDYGCSRSADGIYIALAEYLGKSNVVELLTFDNGFINQSAKNAPSVKVHILPI